MWPNVKPFVMTSPSQFRPQPPIALTGAEWAADYNEIRDFGGRNSTKRTARQTEDAQFWLVTGPASYYPIARQLVVAKNMDVIDSARFMALAATAVADTFIAVFDAKYHYDFWRPITAIRNGDMDDNAATEVAMARIYAGFHYRFSTRVGQDMGRKIGQLTVQTLMQKANMAENR